MRGIFSCAARSLQRGDEMTVLDVIAEGVEADLGSREHNLRRAQQAPRIVDDADRNERRGVRQARLPYAQRRQRGHRSGQQRGGAMIVFGGRRDQHRIDAGCGQRDGADQARPARRR